MPVYKNPNQPTNNAGTLMSSGNAKHAIQRDVDISPAEYGTLELIGSPILSVGDVLGDDGPEVTKVEVHEGQEGITTTYEFQKPVVEGDAEERTIEKAFPSKTELANMSKAKLLDVVEGFKIQVSGEATNKELKEAIESFRAQFESQEKQNV